MDLSLVIDRDKQNVVYEQFENNAKIDSSNWFVVKSTILNGIGYWSVWNSGIYNRPMLQFCTLKKIAVWMIMPIEIIRSMGIQRGKNDKIDSKNSYVCNSAS
ncbi:MAG: hypothetical protein IPI10_14145 [Bacteroidetes bacterium]|nr:hypothetical protein [Bacteroidota bacterium]